ncbi:hypothetical protein [Lysobacter gummosus]|uniref:Uncharacterized protein n=1 Tax=Lysobacter gummosus TaxID=262324 RepID=A0ABY3XFP5_9GAMM|nr:hypothetical protein [Lysobacter gummosus]UNP30466.1 hypothetical protein MOV92_04105 [Lysobacter gummosus]
MSIARASSTRDSSPSIRIAKNAIHPKRSENCASRFGKACEQSMQNPRDMCRYSIDECAIGQKLRQHITFQARCAILTVT